MGIQYIQDADRFLVDEEVDWDVTTSAANNPSPSPTLLYPEIMIGIGVASSGQ